MSGIYSTPTQNSIQKQLGSTLSASATTMVLNEDISTLLANVSTDHPCTCVVDRIDSNGTLTPTKREYITFTGSSGTSLTGLTRNADGSGSDQEHSVGAIVEFIPDVLWAKSIKDYLTAGSGSVTTYTPSAGATQDIDVSTTKIHLITMPAGNVTLTVSNEQIGHLFMIEIVQDGVGSRTVTWFSTIKWVDGVAPTLTTTANKKDSFIFRCTGTDTFDGYIVGQNI